MFRAGGVRFAGARALHASAARRMDDSKHPDQQRAEDLTNEKTDDDPTAGTLGARCWPHLFLAREARGADATEF